MRELIHILINLAEKEQPFEICPTSRGSAHIYEVLESRQKGTDTER